MKHTEDEKKIIKKINHYFLIWKRFSLNSFSIAFVSRLAALMYLSGKLIRFFFFLGFLYLLIKNTSNLGGYDISQITFFFLTFNFIDLTTQFLYREVYNFRSMVVDGTFDYILLKPMNSLFRSLAGGADFLDLLILIPLVIAIIFTGLRFPNINIFNILLYILLMINSFVIATSFHIFVLSIGILTTSVDHAMMIYRDVYNMGRLPVDIYKEPLRSILTFVIPVGIVMTIPAKAMMNILTVPVVLISFMMAIIFYLLSMKFWRYALTRYSSASS